jgi:transcriptional regulator with XRE-family HTH domain
MEQPKKRERQATPRRKGRFTKQHCRFPSEIVADNVRDIRAARRLTQADLSERMVVLGCNGWHRATASEVERGMRSVSVDELFALALALDVTVSKLLDPGGAVTRRSLGLDLGACVPLVDVDDARAFIQEEEARLVIIWEGNVPMATCNVQGKQLLTVIWSATGNNEPALKFMRRAAEEWKERAARGEVPSAKVQKFVKFIWGGWPDTEENRRAWAEELERLERYDSDSPNWSEEDRSEDE